MLSVEEEVEVGQQSAAKLSNICIAFFSPVPACANQVALESHSMFGIPPDIGKRVATA